MKKRIWQRLGAVLLVCCMAVLGCLAAFFPASAEEEQMSVRIYKQYSNLVVSGSNLLEGVLPYLETLENDASFHDVPFGDLTAVRGEIHDGEAFIHFELEAEKFYVVKGILSYGSIELRNSTSAPYDSINLIPSNSSGMTDTYVFYTDQNYRFLYLYDRDYYHSWNLYEVESFDTVYDVSLTTFSDDMGELFGGSIDLSKFSTKRVPADQRSSPYIDILAFYSDVNWGEWSSNSSPSYQSGNDYFYIYNCYGEFPLSGSIRVDGLDCDLTRVSGNRFFTKFKSAVSRQFNIAEIKSRFPVDSITLNFTDGSSRMYPFQNFYIAMEYTNLTDWKIQEVSFSGEQKLKLDIGYTYWRQADYSSKGIGWHNQVDSIYFGIPSALLRGQRLVDAKLEYQKVTTKPIVVTQTSENINGTYVHEWFETTAQDPNNELTHNQGWVRYQKGVPYFYADPALWSKIALIDQHPTFDNQFNVRTSSPNNLHSVYWAFDVEDPTVVDKVPNPGSTTGLSSAALSDPRSSVSRDRLEQWMVNYTLDGATTTYTAANPAYRVGSTVPETVQVNGILFDHAEPRGTYYASQISGRVLEQYGNNHNFWGNLAVGWNYAFAHLFNAVDEQDAVLGFSDFVIDSIDKINDENDANGDHKFAMADMEKLQKRFRSCEANGETLILMPFDTSQYYSAPLYGWYKEGNVDSGSEDAFNGYLAIMDMYLDLHVIELYFQNAIGEVIPAPVTSNHINGIADVTPAPGNAELNEYAGEALKNMFQRTGKNIWDFLKKALVIIAVVVIVLIVLRLVIWIVGRKQSNNTTVVIRDDAPRRNRRRRR